MHLGDHPCRPAKDTPTCTLVDPNGRLAAALPLETTSETSTSVRLEGWSYNELADVMQTTPGALRAAVSRARRKLEDGDASLPD